MCCSNAHKAGGNPKHFPFFLPSLTRRTTSIPAQGSMLCSPLPSQVSEEPGKFACFLPACSIYI
ncbi:Protein of unknown function [Pyronema omphalodes CBS 100304]|uniref:Uncharacterized protein n=1 Tax=Pyronema omphalodes (strain CBS 100304) TaxID=1076935 RepID=U4KXS4_PYROM|nr:Protein of unknown function [Pyronema omphalodes CBS 100304]